MNTFAQKLKGPQQATPATSTMSARAHFGQGRGVNPFLRLQRTIGNHAAQRMLRANLEERNAGAFDMALPKIGHDFSRVPMFSPTKEAIQTKLAVNEPGDVYEQEADRVAEQVMRVAQPAAVGPAVEGVQRECSACGDDADVSVPGPSAERKLQIQRLTNDEGAAGGVGALAPQVARPADVEEPEPEPEAEAGPAGPVAAEVASEATAQTPAPGGRGGEVVHSTARSPEEDPEIARSRGPIPSNTVTCVAKWQPCRAPYSPGTWGARMTYHCPRLILPWGIILPGTTQPAFATIPDEFVGTDPKGRDMYRCRPRVSVNFGADVADSVAFALTRSMLFPGQAACHAGFRANLLAALEAMFIPSGGGRPAGIRVNQTAPGGGGLPFPCP